MVSNYFYLLCSMFFSLSMALSSVVVQLLPTLRFPLNGHPDSFSFVLCKIDIQPIRLFLFMLRITLVVVLQAFTVKDIAATSNRYIVTTRRNTKFKFIAVKEFRKLKFYVFQLKTRHRLGFGKRIFWIASCQTLDGFGCSQLCRRPRKETPK